MSLPAKIQAVILKEKGKLAVEAVNMPSLRPDYMIVKPIAWAVNPTDYKHMQWDMLAKPGIRMGCDYVGTVVKVGDKVTKSFKPGDRVAGMVQGGNQNNLEDGSFAEYIVVKGDVQIKVPDSVSDTEAAGLGVAVVTVGQGLYQTLQLPWPSTVHSSNAQSEDSNAKPALFIYGGSTAMGLAGISFAVASGYRVFTTSSPRNFELLYARGAERVLDYTTMSAAELGGQVRKLTDNKLTKAWDTIALDDSFVACAAALSDAEGANVKLAVLLPPGDGVMEKMSKVNKNFETGTGDEKGEAKVKLTLGYTSLGETVTKWHELPASQEDYEFAKKWWEEARGLLEKGKVQLADAEVNRDGTAGLAGLIKGVSDVGEGKVSARKLVYTAV